MNYRIKKRCLSKITTFYRNVSKKYKHTYSQELMEKNVHDAFDSIYHIPVLPFSPRPNTILGRTMVNFLSPPPFFHAI